MYDFTGENDVIAFIEMVQKTGLLAIVRPGEFFCVHKLKGSGQERPPGFSSIFDVLKSN